MSEALASPDAAAVVRHFLRGVGHADAFDIAADVVANDLLRQRLDAMKRAFPDLTFRVDQLLAEDDLVAVHATASGTHEGMFHGVPPTGRRWRASWTAILRVADGRIADVWDNWDLLSMLEQLGAVKRSLGVSA